MFGLDDITKVMASAGLQSLGIGNPCISGKWTSSGNSDKVTETNPYNLSLTSSENWVAPCGGLLITSMGTYHILDGSGKPIDEKNLVFRIHPLIFLRLKRYYATIIEGKTVNTDQPVRPVPYYFVYSGYDTSTKVTGGLFSAGQEMPFKGTMTIHDENGLPIDPVAVAGTFDQLIENSSILEKKDLLSISGTTQQNRQIYHISRIGMNNENGTKTILHFVDFYGNAIENVSDKVVNVTPVNSNSGYGLFTVTKQTDPLTISASGSNDYRIGPACNGSLSTVFNISSINPISNLNRDFIRLYLIDLRNHLIGNVPDSYPGKNEERPAIRHGEHITVHYNGNAALGGAFKILSSVNNSPASGDTTFVISPVISDDFDIPQDSVDSSAQWPNFPVNGKKAPTGAILASIKDNFQSSAHFITGSNDVSVSISGFTNGQAVRIYNRLFLPDAREGRGDGGGAVADTNGKVFFLLKNPLNLAGTNTPPDHPTLHFDLVLINGDGNARVFGNLTTIINGASYLTDAEKNGIGSEVNLFMKASHRGIATAGVLGLKKPVNSSDNLEATWHPTMARRDTIIASRTGTEFKGQISGMYLTGASRTAIFRKGNPGGKGGREFHIIAAQTEGGLLGYDLARAALRRSVNLNERLGALGNVEWKEPASKIIGTISGAVLQTVASQIETPELLLNSNFYTASSEISVKEFEREKSSCFYGRRDAYWALMNALANAREFVYIEGPAFSQTGYLPNPPDDNSFDVGTNLLYILKQRMLTQKGLKIVAALSKKLDYGPGYEIFAAREYVKREIAVSCFDGKELTEKGMNKRIIAFHPIGFPGRPLELMTNIVIVDDVFAMLGTSTIRRRGMTFDGGLDLVFTDTTIQDGKPKEIREFRRKLMATHINAIPPKENEMPDPDWVRLYDGNQAFEVFRELLEGGGAGLIESVWDGSTPGQQNVSFDGLSDDAADPDGANISPVQSFFSALAESPPK